LNGSKLQPSSSPDLLETNGAMVTALFGWLRALTPSQLDMICLLRRQRIMAIGTPRADLAGD
jgi:hypothetical protein